MGLVVVVLVAGVFSPRAVVVFMVLYDLMVNPLRKKRWVGSARGLGVFPCPGGYGDRGFEYVYLEVEVDFLEAEHLGEDADVDIAEERLEGDKGEEEDGVFAVGVVEVASVFRPGMEDVERIALEVGPRQAGDEVARVAGRGGAVVADAFDDAAVHVGAVGAVRAAELGEDGVVGVGPLA